MGHIGELMAWYEEAHAKFEKHGAVIVEGKTREARGGATTRPKRRLAPTQFGRLTALMAAEPGLSAAELCERVGCAYATVYHAKAVLKGASWAKPPKGWARGEAEGGEMSARAQVTAAHRETARLITWQNLPHNEIAQIIADSEAAAVARHIEHIDLMVDELMRIRALTGYDSEIGELCTRGISGTYQHFPLIVQRDRAEAERDELRTKVAQLTHERDQWEAMARTA